MASKENEIISTILNADEWDEYYKSIDVLMDLNSLIDDLQLSEAPGILNSYSKILNYLGYDLLKESKAAEFCYKIVTRLNEELTKRNSIFVTFKLLYAKILLSSDINEDSNSVKCVKGLIKEYIDPYHDASFFESFRMLKDVYLD